MVRSRITNKMLRESECPVVYVRENDFKVLFDYGYPLWYTAGKYGWNADYWMTDCGLMFTKGTRPYYTDKLSDYALIKDHYQKIDEALYTERRKSYADGNLMQEDFVQRVMLYRNAMARELYEAIQSSKGD